MEYLFIVQSLRSRLRFNDTRYVRYVSLYRLKHDAAAALTQDEQYWQRHWKYLYLPDFVFTENYE